MHRVINTQELFVDSRLRSAASEVMLELRVGSSSCVQCHSVEQEIMSALSGLICLS